MESVLDVSSQTVAHVQNALTWNALVGLEWKKERVGVGNAQTSIQHMLQQPLTTLQQYQHSLLKYMDLVRMSYWTLKYLVHTCSWNVCYYRLWQFLRTQGIIQRWHAKGNLSHIPLTGPCMMQFFQTHIGNGNPQLRIPTRCHNAHIPCSHVYSPIYAYWCWELLDEPEPPCVQCLARW